MQHEPQQYPHQPQPPRNGDDALKGAPWYVRALDRFGVATVFASILMWFMLTDVRGSLAAVVAAAQSLTATQTVVLRNQEHIIRLLTDHENNMARMQRVLMCYASARTVEERGRCPTVN